MDTRMDQFAIAKIIAESVERHLVIALEHGCVASEVPAIAKSIGGNAGAALYFELCDRGVDTSGAE